MLISRVQKIDTADFCELRALIESASLKEPFVLWYRFPSAMTDFIDPKNGDPFLVVGLLPAMRTGEALEVSASVSPMLLRSTDTIQDIYKSWDPSLHRATINCPDRDLSLPVVKPSGVGLYFSLGVDSFYSFLKNITCPNDNAATITHLIVVHGFDVYYGKWNSALFTDVLRNAMHVGREFGKALLPVATNLRDFSDQFADWGVLYHGAALAIVGLALQNAFKVLLVAATDSYANLIPRGSHPILDPLWSTETTRFVQDGCEATRLDKTRFIARFPIVLDTLRVCFMNPNTEYNCGRCEKCLRTMIGLHIAGALSRCRTLPHGIDTDLASQIAVHRHEEFFISELVDALGQSPMDQRIRRALEQSLARCRRVKAASTARHRLLPMLRDVLGRLEGLRRRRAP